MWTANKHFIYCFQNPKRSDNSFNFLKLAELSLNIDKNNLTLSPQNIAVHDAPLNKGSPFSKVTKFSIFTHFMRHDCLIYPTFIRKTFAFLKSNDYWVLKCRNMHSSRITAGDFCRNDKSLLINENSCDVWKWWGGGTAFGKVFRVQGFE